MEDLVKPEDSSSDEIDETWNGKIIISSKDKSNFGENPGGHIQELLQRWTRYRRILNENDPAVYNTAAELCVALVKTRSFDALAVFLDNIPDTREYQTNESIVRAKVHVALSKKDTKLVYELLDQNYFEDGEDLIKVWDEALYIDEEMRTKKTLTPLSRFRVRKRYPPPKSICADGIRKTNTLPREATTYLKSWLMEHLSDPYPNAAENQQLAKISGLTQAQVKTWFANARRRSKNTEEFQKRCKPVSDISPVSFPLPQLPLPPSINHPSYFLYGASPLPSPDGGSAFGPACCDFYPSFTGFNRHNQYLGDEYPISPINNTMRAWRPPDVVYYDGTARNFLDVNEKNLQDYAEQLYY